MKRTLEKELIHWKNTKNQLPIILRGARQVGKSFLVEKFGQEQFQNVVTVNFEFQPKFKECFEKLNPVEINQVISVLTGEEIIPGKTLLFFDEIQECPEAIQALRYYKEKLPTQHVIGAGSLLEFVLDDERFRMPVGRVQYLYLQPLSFKEFLVASQNTSLLAWIEKSNLNVGMPHAIHAQCLDLLKKYFILGGMPGVLSEYFLTKNFKDCQHIQSAILNTYQNDFGKYARRADYQCLQKLFSKAPGLIGKQFRYVSVDPGMRSRNIKQALEKLYQAGVLFPIFATKASGLPLNSLANEKRFKLVFLDVGLVKRAMHLDVDLLLSDDLLLLNQGAIAEQYVGQEIMAYMNPYERPALFYWIREKHNSQAEIDYVINVGSTIVPVEVKAGKTGRLKSIRQFMDENKSRLGVQISQAPLELKGDLLSIPLYMVSEMNRLVENMLQL